MRSHSLLLALVAASAAVPVRAQLKTYDTKYYVLKTDVDPAQVRETTQRITLMAEAFHARTRGFAGTVQQRLPLYVFRKAEDYYAQDGLRGSAGAFTGDKLMIIAGEQVTPHTWRTLQHEGFHQFAHAAIGPGLPPWANEGLAEYFGHGVFTGDHFYTGLIPPERLLRVRQGIQAKRRRPLIEMMRLGQEIWNTEVGLAQAQAGANYDQAWSMIHFLAHADQGRYQDAFAQFLRAVSRGQPWEPAWIKSFGNSVDAFQQRWEAYWLGLPDQPTDTLYAEATVATLTSFLARAASQRQNFDSFQAFLAAAQAGKLKAHTEDWLPPALLDTAVRQVDQRGQWSLQKRPGQQLLVCQRADGTVLEGQFRIANGRIRSVDVHVRPPKGARK